MNRFYYRKSKRTQRKCPKNWRFPSSLGLRPVLTVFENAIAFSINRLYRQMRYNPLDALLTQSVWMLLHPGLWGGCVYFWSSRALGWTSFLLFDRIQPSWLYLKFLLWGMGKIIRHCRTCADAPVFGNAFFWVLFAFFSFWCIWLLWFSNCLLELLGICLIDFWSLGIALKLGCSWQGDSLELLVMNDLHIYCNMFSR